MKQSYRSECLPVEQLRAIARNNGGATAIEYALIAAGIAMAIVLVVPAVGSTVAGLFNSVLAAFA